MHAYPIMREYVLRTPYRGFIAIPSSGEVTYVWSTGPDEVAMRTVYGKEMPGHCAMYFSPRQATRRLSCLRLAAPAELSKPEATVVRLGPPPVEPDALQRLFCVCAPVRDYTGQEVARVGVFGHGADDRPDSQRTSPRRVGSRAPHLDAPGPCAQRARLESTGLNWLTGNW